MMLHVVERKSGSTEMLADAPLPLSQRDKHPARSMAMPIARTMRNAAMQRRLLATLMP